MIRIGSIQYLTLKSIRIMLVFNFWDRGLDRPYGFDSVPGLTRDRSIFFYILFYYSLKRQTMYFENIYLSTMQY